MSQDSQNHENLSNLYQELECQHHLVQDEPFAKPMIPALTAEGFAHWMTTWIRAYPEQEAKRLEKVVVSMPIDADGETVDGKPERLPKVCSRRSAFERIANRNRSKFHAISFLVENILSPKRQFAMQLPSSWTNLDYLEPGSLPSLALP